MSLNMSAKTLPNQEVSRVAREEDLLSGMTIAASNLVRQPVCAPPYSREETSERREKEHLFLPEHTVERWNSEVQTLLGTSGMGLIYTGTKISTDMSPKKLAHQAVLGHASDEDSGCEVPIATSNPFRPAVYATGYFWEKLSELLENDLLLMSEDTVKRLDTEMEILRGTSEIGLIYIGTSLPEMLGLQRKVPNIDGVALDACVITSDQPVQILTFVRSHAQVQDDTLMQRNAELSKGVLYLLREFTDEKFHILNGVLDFDDLRDGAGFEDKRNALRKKSCLYVNPRSLEMNPSKCKNLRKAFFVASAVDHTSNQTSSDKIVLLKRDGFMVKLKYHGLKVYNNPASIKTENAQGEVVTLSVSKSGTTMQGVERKRSDSVPRNTAFLGLHPDIVYIRDPEGISENNANPLAGRFQSSTKVESNPVEEKAQPATQLIWMPGHSLQ